MQLWLAAGLLGGVIAACSGSDGAAGTNGTNGATGATGAPGSAGPSGTPGTAGTTGPMGPAGSAGPTGTAGPTGSVGPTGSAGPMGSAGPAVSLTPAAAKGLAIAPVALNLAGKTADQIEQIGYGSYIVNAMVGCGDCHDKKNMDGTTSHLAGGNKFDLGAGQVYARNLTSDKSDPAGQPLTEDQFIESLRTGKDQKDAGKQLVVMPWASFRWASTSDLKAIYAYTQAVPPVANVVTPDTKGPLGAAGPVPFPTSYDEGDVTRPLPAEADAKGVAIPDPGNLVRGRAIQPLAEPNAYKAWPPEQQALFARGAYMVNSLTACGDCHTNPTRKPMTLKINTDQYLSGGAVFSVPAALGPTLHQQRVMSANLSGAVNGEIPNKLDFSTFVAIITSGTHVDDSPARPLGFRMPWQKYRNLTLADLESIYFYLQNITHPTGANDKVTQDYTTFCAMDSDCDTAGGETCNTATSECIGAACVGNGDCPACQTCSNKKCAAPDAMSTCPKSGLLAARRSRPAAPEHPRRGER
jgi:hypothetical protein